MRISSKGRYAISFMIDLANFNTGQPVALKDVAKRQDIPEKYLEQIVAVMNKAGYVRSVRGAQGGYMLRNAPKTYTLDMILKLTEKNLVPNELDRSDLCSNKPSDEAFLKIYDRVNDAIYDALHDITLEDIVDWQQDSWSNFSI